MWRSKKFIIITVLVVLVVGGTLGGVAIAQANDQSTTTPTVTPTATDNVSSFLQKVADIYKANTGDTIDPEQLQKAIADARQALQEEALDNYLQKLVDEGKITQEQADQFKAWWDQRPSLDAFQSWWQSMPDIPGIFGGKDNDIGMGPLAGLGGLGKFRMGFRLGLRCAPDTSTN
jgi:ABC-type sugar transport system substrate-binding protein